MKLTQVSDDGDVRRLRVTGRVVQVDTSSDLEQIGQLLGSHGYARNVVLSLMETEFIDSTGLGWLLACHKKFYEAGGKLVIHSIPPGTLDTLKIMRLQVVLHLAEDEAAALALVRGENP